MSLTTAANGGAVALAATSQTSYASSAAKQPGDNAVMLFVVTSTTSAGTPNVPTIAAPWSWASSSLITTVTDNAQRRLTALWATGTGAANSTYTVDFAGQLQAGCICGTSGFSGANLVTPWTSLTTKRGAAGSQSHATVFFTSTPVAANWTLGAIANDGNQTMTPGSGYTQLLQNAGASAGAERILLQAILGSGTSTIDATFTAANWLGIGLELQPAAAVSAGGIPYSFRRRRMEAGT